MSKYANIQEANASNQKLLCKVHGCNRNRYRISGYCRYHNRVNNLYGSPHHTRIAEKDYVIEFLDCIGVISHNFNQGHQGIRYGIKFFQQWLDDASRGIPSTKGKYAETVMRHFRRLNDAGVDPMDLLSTSAALVLMQQKRPESIRDGRHLIYAIGYRLLRSALYAGNARGPLSREVGTHVWDNLRTLLVNIAVTVIRKEQENDAALNAMHAPLSL